MVDLAIGPDPTAREHFGQTLDIWKAFVERLAAPLPFEISRLTESQFHQHCSSVAVAMPRLRDAPRPDLGRIALSAKFFDSDADQRFSTLLHESIHIRLLTGPFRARFAAGLLLDRREAPRVVDDRSNKRYYLAFLVLGFPDEVAAESYLATHYETHFACRLQHYLTMRRQNARAPLQDLVPSSLKPYAHFYELMRADLGVRLSRGTSFEAQMIAVRVAVGSAFDSAGYEVGLGKRLLGLTDELQAVAGDSESVSLIVGELFEEIAQAACQSIG